jgi:hypothetical protein
MEDCLRHLQQRCAATTEKVRTKNAMALCLGSGETATPRS